MATSAPRKNSWRCWPTANLSEIELPDPALRWQDQLAALYRSVRDVMLKHPTLVPIIANQRLDRTSAYRGAEVVCGALRANGLPDPEVITSFATLTSFTVGSVQRELAARGSSARPGLASLPASDFPKCGLAVRPPGIGRCRPVLHRRPPAGDRRDRHSNAPTGQVAATHP